MWKWILRLIGLQPKSDNVPDEMKYLITGLGNIGAEYDGTRHNVGFEVVDYLAEQHEGVWKELKYGSLATIKYKGRQLLLLKPNTYMNLSGKAIKYWLQKENIPLDRSLTILDDLNLDFGTIRLRNKGSDGGHNGLKSIQENLGRSDYPRLRIGIGNNYRRGQQVDYVLGRWESEEEEGLPQILKKAAAQVKEYVFNRKPSHR